MFCGDRSWFGEYNNMFVVRFEYEKSVFNIGKQKRNEDNEKFAILKSNAKICEIKIEEKCMRN